MELNKALFLDLDGTIIQTKSGRRFPLHSEDWKLNPTVLDIILDFYNKGYKLVIVTNQGGIESGYIKEAVFVKKIEKICETIEKLLKLKKNSISYYYCTSMDSYNRKPNPGMAIDAAQDYELSLTSSIMVGDFESDEQFAKECGMALYIDATTL